MMTCQVEMTGAWLETEQDVIESRADLRNRVGSVLEESDLTEERRDEVMNALRIGEQPVREVMVDVEDPIDTRYLSEFESSYGTLSFVAAVLDQWRISRDEQPTVPIHWGTSGQRSVSKGMVRESSFHRPGRPQTPARADI